MWLALTSFEVAVVQYSEAIASLEDVVCHIRLHGDVPLADVEGKRLAPLFWSRADVQGYLGRFLSAAGDCALALAHDRGFDQVMTMIVSVRACIKVVIDFKSNIPVLI